MKKKANVGKETAIVFCSSYHEIVCALSIIEKLYASNSILLVASGEKLSEAIKSSSPYQLKTCIIPPLSFNPSSPLLSFIHISRQKQRIKNLFSEFHDSNVYFFVTSWGYEVIWSVYLLSFFNRIYYLPSVDLWYANPNRAPLRSYLLYLVYKIPGLSIYSHGSSFRSIVDSTFIKLINAKMLPISKLVRQDLRQRKNQRILLLFSLKTEVGENSYTKYLDLVKKLIELFEAHVDVKQHPRDHASSFLQSASRLTILPKDESASLYLENYSIIIGYSSSLLINASSLYQTVVISLIDAIKSDNSFDAKQYLLRNQNSISPIVFPEERELVQILSEKLKIQ